MNYYPHIQVSIKYVIVCDSASITYSITLQKIKNFHVSDIQDIQDIQDMHALFTFVIYIIMKNVFSPYVRTLY
jgi:hypothetical protein